MPRPAASAVGSLVVLVAWCLGVTPAYAEENAPARPNILLILADDLGYEDVGFQGSKDIRTPALDRLAAGGTTFSSAYVVHPFCGPSRMGLLTGRYPYEFGAPYNLPDNSKRTYQDQGVPANETLVSTVLKDAGYHTGIMGKWHLGQQPEHHPNNRGFNDFFGFLGGGILYFGPYKANNKAGNVWDYKRFPERNGKDVTTLTEKDYMTDVLSREGVDFINKSAKTDEPFFLLMSYNAPHTPLAAKDEDLALFPNLSGKRRTYAAMVYALDRGVGHLVEALKKTGQYDNTLIVFLSDNGGRTDQGASNLPLTGRKGDTTEGGYRTPMLFHWPKVVKAGQQYDHPVTALDFYPTFAKLAGAKIPDDKDLDGKDIWDAFVDGRNPREGEMLYTIRHRNGFSDVGARQDEWKVCRTQEEWKLFNISQDIQESRDLSSQHPDVLQRMVSGVQRLCESHTEPLWFDNKKQAAEWQQTGMPNFGFAESGQKRTTDSRAKPLRPFGGVINDSDSAWKFDAGQSDEFNGTTVDTRKWNIDSKDFGPWSWEPENVTQEDGSMHLRMVRKDHQRRGEQLHYTSGMARIDKTITYGYFEARIKGCSRYPGACPSFWLYSIGPQNRFKASDGETVAYSEIDVVELQQSEYDFEAKKHFPVTRIDCNLHTVLMKDGKRVWSRPNNAPKLCKTHFDAPWDPRQEYHVYAVKNTREEIVWYIDGKEVGRKPNLYWHLPMHVTLSLGLRYPFVTFKDGEMAPVSDKTTADGFPTHMSVDYVRVWRFNGSGSKNASTDWSKQQYIAREKANWEKNGWAWNQARVESNFAEIDANKDGLASGKERQVWFANKKKDPK